ncbi:MAG: hypothetical protein HOM20_12690 [Porticoccaceae bacterium]|jgi:hypothetical protein|nr:hypothetical protein [Porticoccaceae bacterium]
MAIVIGQVESLRKLKETLSERGITRFNSTGDISSFAQNYDFERDQARYKSEKSVESEIEELKFNFSKHEQSLSVLRSDLIVEIEEQKQALGSKIRNIQEKRKKSLIQKIITHRKLKSLTSKKSSLEADPESYISHKTRTLQREKSEFQDKYHYLYKNREKVISDRSKAALDELASIKKSIDDLYPLIAGAIGESAVENELQKLSDQYYVINDFSLRLNPPIYNRKTKDRICSIQIDHLLICRSGVFLLETKNWSESSIESLDLRSPVEQVLRTSFALFVLLNGRSRSKFVKLDEHHWGSKKLPIRNVIVMTNAKPRTEFNHIKILSLKELNGYIRYFDPVLNDQEVKSIFESLSNRR